MPRATKSKGVAASVPYAGTVVGNIESSESEIETVSVATETEADVRDDLPFEVNITAAPDDYRPDRSPAGRKRLPSPFEAILPDLKGKGWQNQPHDGKVTPYNQEEVDNGGTPKYNTGASIKDSNARVIHRELHKAVKYLNSPDGGDWNLGLDINITETDVQFNIRDKQKRKKGEKVKSPDGGDAESSEDVDFDYDNGDE